MNQETTIPSKTPPQLTNNVYWLDGKSSNFYLCADEDHLTLIDSGLPNREQLVFEAIQQLGYQLADLKQILITHADIDHAGSAALIQAQTGAAVYAGVETAAYLCRGKSPSHMPWLAQWLIDRFVSYTPIPPDSIITIEDGDTLPLMGGLQVLATPGHTLDHHSFYSHAAGILFAGDALNTRRNRLQRTPKRITADEEAANRSAIHLLALTPAIIACGHGVPLSDHSSADLMTLLDKLRHT